MRFRWNLMTLFEKGFLGGHPLARTYGLITLSTLLILLFGHNAHAAPAISSAQIDQIKKMSPAQREALAKRYDIPLERNSALASPAQREPDLNPALQPPDKISDSEATVETSQVKTSAELPRFGERLFAMRDSIYEPRSSTVVSQNYLLGPGDSFSVRFCKVSAVYEVMVENDGALVVPELGSLSVTGLTFTEFKELVSNVVKERMIGTEVFLSPMDLKQISIVVVGEVKKPGTYLLSALANPIHALYVAGGPGEIGSYRNIRLTKLSGEVHELDLYDLLRKGQPLLTPLSDGDTIYIPPLDGEVSINGEVKRPARYEAGEFDNC